MTIAERRLIEQWKDDDKFNSEIASLLGKAPQTINTEIKRGLITLDSLKLFLSFSDCVFFSAINTIFFSITLC